MTRRKHDPVPQKELAQRLRYWIDIGDEAHVASLIAENPINSRSSHVKHNLGLGRMAWLNRKGFCMNQEPCPDHPA